MIAEVQKRQQRAEELSRIWDCYFSALKGKAGTDYWIVLLEDHTFNVLVQVIKQLARKRFTNHSMPLADMLSYVEQTSSRMNADKPAPMCAKHQRDEKEF